MVGYASQGVQQCEQLLIDDRRSQTPARRSLAQSACRLKPFSRRLPTRSLQIEQAKRFQ